MARWRAALILLATLAPGAASAQTAEGDGSAGGTPFDFSFGPQEDGHLGAVLNGSRFYALSAVRGEPWTPIPRTLVSPFAGLVLDAGWSSAPDALNNSSLSFRPAIGVSRIGRRIEGSPGAAAPDSAPTFAGPWLHLYGDLRQRFGRFRAEDGAGAESVNQTMLGLGAQLRWVGFPDAYASLLDSFGLDTGREDQPPTLDLTWYSVRSTASDLMSLPDGVTADVLRSTLRGELTLPLLCARREIAAPGGPDDPFGAVAGAEIACPLGLTGAATGTLPLGVDGVDPGLLLDVGVYLHTGGSLRPVIRFRAGEEHGLDYDRQILLGLLWDLSG